MLNDEAELHTMLAAARASIADRLLPVSRDEVLDYAATRLSAEDAEWISVLNDESKREWKKLVEKYRSAKGHPQ